MARLSRSSLDVILAIMAGAPLFLSACDTRDDAVVVIALHPSNPHILYIATNDYIYKSRDEGATWEKISGGMSHSRVISIAIDPAFPATVYAGTKGDAVYKSYDGGQRWVPLKTGLDDVTITSVVNQLLFDPANANRLFAATTMGVFESVDAGETWKKRMAGMKEVLMVVCLAIDPVHSNILYAGTSGGVYKSIDQGRSWAKANQGLISPEVLSTSRALMVNTLVIDPGQSDIVYAGSLNGLYRSVDSGRSWARIGRSLPDQMVIAMAMDTSSDAALYVAGRQGVYKSTDAGMTWNAMNEGLTSLNIRSLAVSPSDPHTLYLGSNSTGLYRSQDGGGRWKSVRLNVVKLSP
jgi:photosystem II stability/assembly factor-like uncharacterized protein